MRNLSQILSIVVLSLSLTQCETVDGPGSGGSAKTVTVTGTLFYPDEANTTFIVPEGAQIIGAGGRSCHYIVHKT